MDEPTGTVSVSTMRPPPATLQTPGGKLRQTNNHGRELSPCTVRAPTSCGATGPRNWKVLASAGCGTYVTPTRTAGGDRVVRLSAIVQVTPVPSMDEPPAKMRLWKVHVGVVVLE